MGNVMAYSGLVTKVRAMQAKLLTDQDLSERETRVCGCTEPDG